MRPHPRGFGAAWSVVVVGGLALVAFDLAHLHGAPPVPRAAPSAPAVSPSSSAPAVALPPPAQSASSGQAGGSAETSTLATPRTVGPSLPGSVPSPSRTPAPGRSPLVGVAASLVVPLRGSTPLAVRVAVVAPAAPPFPMLSAGLLLPLG